MAAVFIEASTSPAVMIDRIFQLRNRVFHDALHWDVQSLHGREIDSFDTGNAVYGAVHDAAGQVEGCFRLLPTTDRYMLRDVFPQLLHGHPAPDDATVWESSRFAVMPSLWRGGTLRGLIEVTSELLSAQITWCLEHGVTRVLSVTDLTFERVLRSAGLRCQRYGPPIQIGVTRAVAGWMEPREEQLAAIRDSLERLRDAQSLASQPTAAE